MQRIKIKIIKENKCIWNMKKFILNCLSVLNCLTRKFPVCLCVCCWTLIFHQISFKKKKKKCQHYEINRGAEGRSPTGVVKRLYTDGPSQRFWVDKSMVTYWNGSTTAKISHDSRRSQSPPFSQRSSLAVLTENPPLIIIGIQRHNTPPWRGLS